jgi:FtsH-binding integral membrane protein
MNLFNGKYWEGRFIDLWSIPHFLTGVVIALIIVFFGQSFMTGFLVTMAVAIAWEIFEILIKVHEINTNSITDIFVALIGYCIFFYLPKVLSLERKEVVILLGVCIAIFLISSLIGWFAYRHYSPGR